MLGALLGDIVGSTHEWSATKTKEFDFYLPASFATDDSYATIAVASCLLDGPTPDLYRQRLHDMVHRFPEAGWGGKFYQWALSRTVAPYNSWGNGSAMRVSAVGFALNSVDEVLSEAAQAAAVSHNHPEGIKGAQATALAILLARQRAAKDEIRERIGSFAGYDLNRTVQQVRATYAFTESCQETVPEAIIAFLESTGIEDAIRNAISLGGDADTLAAITGAIAHAHYGFPDASREFVRARFPEDLWRIVERFEERFGGE